jgi:hypothetical protein
MTKSQPPPARQLHPAAGCLWLLILCGLMGAVVALPLVRRGRPPVATFLITSASVFVLMMAVIFLLTRSGRLYLRQLARSSDRVDWRAVRRASPAMRMIDSPPPFTIWTDLPGGVPFDVHREADRLCQEFTALTGLAVTAVRPLRIVLFERWETYRRYAAGVMGDFDLAGFYMKLVTGRMALNQEASRAVFENAEAGAFEILMGHHLLIGHYGKVPEQWLQSGVVGVLLKQLGTMSSVPGRNARFLAAELQRGELLSIEELLGQSGRLLVKLSQQKGSQAEKTAVLTRIGFQGGQLVSWLSRHRRPRFAEFLESRRPTRMTPETFEREFGVSAAEILAESARELTASPPPAYEPPPEHLRSLIDDRWVPKLLDPSVPLPVRRLIIANFSRMGYPWPADVLVRIADDDLDELQPHALYTVENIAGRVFRRDQRGMQAWYRGLPREVVSPRSSINRVSTI